MALYSPAVQLDFGAGAKASSALECDGISVPPAGSPRHVDSQISHLTKSFLFERARPAGRKALVMGLLAELEEVDYLLSAECEKLTEELREKCRARRPEVAQVLKDVKAAVTDGKVVTDTRDKPERLLGSSAMRRLIEEVLDHPEGRRYGACMAAWAADADLKQTAERKKSSMLATLLSLIFEDEITGMIDWRRNYARIGRPE